MGLWRRWSHHTAQIMHKFPVSVNSYITEKSEKRKIWTSQVQGNPRRMNSSTGSERLFPSGFFIFFSPENCNSKTLPCYKRFYRSFLIKMFSELLYNSISSIILDCLKISSILCPSVILGRNREFGGCWLIIALSSWSPCPSWSTEHLPQCDVLSTTQTKRDSPCHPEAFNLVQKQPSGPILCKYTRSFHCCSVAKSCTTLCDPMNCSTPGFPVLHYLWVCSNSCPLSQVVPVVKNPVSNAGDVRCQEDPLEESMATHFSILAWRIPVDIGAWRVMVHRVTKSRMWLKRLRMHKHGVLNNNNSS